MKLKQFIYGSVIASLTAFGAIQASAEQFVSIATGGVTCSTSRLLPFCS